MPNRFLPSYHNRKITSLITMIVLLIGISLTARLADQEQEIRQRANETTTPLTTISQTPIISSPTPITAVTIDPLATSLTLTVQLANVNNPTSPTRAVTMSVYNEKNALLISETAHLTLQNNTYTGTVNIPNLQTGSYAFKVKSPGFLQSTTGILPRQIQKGQQIIFPRIILTPGDVNDDNTINTLDLNTLNSCIEMITSCESDTKEASDLNSDGIIDRNDRTILLQHVQ
jgi:hypothetical protein